MVNYNPAREVTPEFLGRVAAWIEATGEVLLVLRYLGMAGSRDYAFCRTREEFESLVKRVSSGTDICVFRDRQLPLRGIVDDVFVAAALQNFPEGTEYLLISIETQPDTRISRIGRFSDTQVDLCEDLSDLFGAEVALGLCPNFCVADHEGYVSAAKDGIDGPR